MTEKMEKIYKMVSKSNYGGVTGILSSNIVDLEHSSVFGNTYRALVRKNKIVKTTIGDQIVFIAIKE
jgi:hypothetical protein